MSATFTYLYSINLYNKSSSDIASSDNRLPRKASADEIAEKIGASRTSVLGALRGNSTGYKKEESLEYFGLVAHEKKTTDKRTVVVYGLTSLGIKEKELTKKQEKHRKYRRETEECAIEEG